MSSALNAKILFTGASHEAAMVRDTQPIIVIKEITISEYQQVRLKKQLQRL